jgi:hypothetical protein
MFHHLIGYWEQHGLGRQPMENLVLEFQDGEIRGQGDDIVGPFTFQGHLAPNGRVLLNKYYRYQHRVLYEGQYDGEGTIFGQWSIGPWYRGDFMLRLNHVEEDTVAVHEIKQIVCEPEAAKH